MHWLTYLSLFSGPLLFLWLWRQLTARRYPKGYRRDSTRKNITPEQQTQLAKRRLPINRDRYLSSKIPDDLDAIVIGSGIGGLSCAAFLSRCGYRVLVLEQHYLAGGTTHTFEDHGFEWETGIHYIGNIKKRGKVLDLITQKPIQWTQLGWERKNPEQMIYDEIVIGGDADDGGQGELRHEYRAGEAYFIEDLIKRFPAEAENIYHYVQLVKQVAQKDEFFLLKIVQPKWLRTLILRTLNWWCSWRSWGSDQHSFYYWTQKTVQAVMDEMFTDPNLIAILCGQFGDYGPPPSEASFFMHASVVNHYLEGGFYPTGGSSEFAKQIIPTIEETGGRVLVHQPVAKILVDEEKEYTYENGMCEEELPPKVIGVEMANGDQIHAPLVISDAGVANTYGQLLDHHLAEEYGHWSAIRDKLGPSTSFVFLFVGLNGEPEELGLKSCNSWIYPSRNYDQVVTDFLDDPFHAPMPLFIASAACKDADWVNRYPGKSSIILLTLGRKEWFAEWEDKKCLKRGTEYEGLKNKLGERMLNEGLYRFYPQLKKEERVAYWTVGTPLSIQHYLGSPSGEAYGLDCQPERFNEEIGGYLEPETGIRGLYLTGQDICTLGFTGALMGGVLTAHRILGYGTVRDLVTGRNLIDDLQSVDQMKK